MATRVGIISDTHGLLRPEVVKILKTCDCILHAGDITEEALLDQIRYLGRLYVVRGNNDFGWARVLSRKLRFRIEELEFLMVHDQLDVGRDYEDVQVIIFGHSHRYSEWAEKGRLWLNPGSCGYPRFGGDVTMAVMTVEGSTYQVEKIILA